MCGRVRVMEGAMLRLRTAALAATLAGLALFAGGNAQAANWVLNLTGDANNTTTDSFTFGGVTYETGQLALEGFTPFTLADGDTVEVTVDITNGPFVVPIRDQMFFGLNFSDLLGGAQPDAVATGTFSFDGGADVGAGCGNCTSLISGLNNTPLSFANLFATGSFAFAVSGGSLSVESISVSYQVNNDAAVPEPASWALMIAGFGGAGAMIRRRRADGTVVAA
jgi:hypothetical protein